jgi:cytidylate kinase
LTVNIAVDGPAGAGKSTIAKKIARKLGIVYVDTGAMYRAMGLFFQRKGISAEDEAAISRAVKEVHITISYADGQQKVFLDGEDVTIHLRTEEAGRLASLFSVYPAVRKKLVELQKELAAQQDVIMDGRDIGTVVLPDAKLKIYLTADSRVRALRRYQELKEKGEVWELDVIEKKIIDRDYQDMHREESPLRQAEDAVVVDTSDMDIDQVVQTVVRLYQDKAGKDRADREA